MHLFPPPLVIRDTEGFTREKDIFGRATIGRGLTNILMNVTNPLVIAVDGQWGSGKTTFLKMWAGELRKAGIPIVYFDAFEHDYAEDAFTAIAGQLVSLAQERRKADASAVQTFVHRAVGAGKVILRGGLKVGVKLATAGALEAADFGNAASDIAKHVSDLEDTYLGELLTKEREQKGAIQSFRDALADLPNLLLQDQDGEPRNAAKQKPLIIIIDELDRCRPVFALQVLERIKHFFAVPRVHFVLGANLGQLRNSVIVAYGPTINAHTYLQKFIHLTLPLVDAAIHRHQRTNVKFIDHLVEVMQFENSKTVESAKEYFEHVAEKRNLSLREIERLMSTLAIALAHKPEGIYSPIAIILGLCVLKVLDPDLYANGKSGTLVWDEVKKPLGLPGGDDGMVGTVSKHWQFCTDPTLVDSNPLHSAFGVRLSEYNLDRRQVVPWVANAVMDRLLPP